MLAGLNGLPRVRSSSVILSCHFMLWCPLHLSITRAKSCSLYSRESSTEINNCINFGLEGLDVQWHSVLNFLKSFSKSYDSHTVTTIALAVVRRENILALVLMYLLWAPRKPTNSLHCLAQFFNSSWRTSLVFQKEQLHWADSFACIVPRRFQRSFIPTQ